jgi:Fe-S-cluster containining protein
MTARWFDGGLRFACRQCGSCCTGEPGFVYLRAGEADRIAAHLGLDPVAFRARHTRRVPGGTSLCEEEDGRCAFFEAGCRIYPVRPRQCRTYPFWQRVVASPEAWREEAGRCPGMDGGPVHPVEEICEAAGLRLRDGR